MNRYFRSAIEEKDIINKYPEHADMNPPPRKQRCLTVADDETAKWINHEGKMAFGSMTSVWDDNISQIRNQNDLKDAYSNFYNRAMRQIVDMINDMYEEVHEDLLDF